MTSLAQALVRHVFVALVVAAGSTMALAGVTTSETVIPVARQLAMPVPAQTGDGGLGDGGGNGSGGCTDPSCGAGNLPQPGGPVGNPGGSPGGNVPPVGGKPNTGGKTPVLGGGGGGGGGGAAPAVASNSGGDGRDNAQQQRGSSGSDSGDSAPPAQGGGKRPAEVLYTHDDENGKGSAGAGAAGGRVQCSDGACVTMPFLPAWVVVLGATVLICVTFYVGMRLVGSRLRRWVE